MKLFVDTNVLSKVIRAREPSYRASWTKAVAEGHELHTSVLVVSELEFGALKSPFPHVTRLKYRQILRTLKQIHEFSLEDASIAASIRMDLKVPGANIGDFDVLIAAQALRLKMPMVTNNRKHFLRVKNLEILDWS